MTILSAVILGIVEGITEFLPISSTGHLILAGKLLGIPSTEAVKSFEIAIQLGAILAVFMIYRRTIFLNRKTWPAIVAAFIPTAIIGFLLHSIVKKYLLGSDTVVVWSLLIGGIGILLFEAGYRNDRSNVRSLEAIPLKTAVGIGLCQSLALIPGVSRSAATIIGGMLLGVERRTIVDFSFLLAIPTMAAATGLDLIKSAGSFSAHDGLTLAVGFIVAFITAYASVTWLLKFIQTHTFTPFGIYRIVVATAWWIL